MEDGAEKSNWVAVPNSDGVVREVKERRVVSREETEEVKETEDVQHLGDITDEVRFSGVIAFLVSSISVVIGHPV